MRKLDACSSAPARCGLTRAADLRGMGTNLTEHSATCQHAHATAGCTPAGCGGKARCQGGDTLHKLTCHAVPCCAQVDPSHLHVWQAWGCMEYRQQNYDTGELRGLYNQG